MRRAVMYAVLVAAAAIISSTNAAAQQSPPMIAAATGTPFTEGWTDKAARRPQTPTGPVVVVPTREAPADAPLTVDLEETGSVEVKREVDFGIQNVIEEDTFLLAVRHHGFWAMPPGGFTRFLIQPPVPINPDTAVADPLVASLRP